MKPDMLEIPSAMLVNMPDKDCELIGRTIDGSIIVVTCRRLLIDGCAISGKVILLDFESGTISRNTIGELILEWHKPTIQPRWKRLLGYRDRGQLLIVENWISQ